MTNPEIDEIVTGLRQPEGPVWLPDGRVLVVEQEAGRISSCLKGERTTISACGGGPNGAAIGPDGALYVCNHGGTSYVEGYPQGWLVPGDQSPEYSGGSIQRVDLKTGVATDIYRSCNGHSLKGPNDLVFDRFGGFWFTDFGKSRPRERDRGGVYYAHPDGSFIREVVFPLDCPNGIGLSPDGTRLYVAETYVARVWAWDILEPGQLRINPLKPAHGATLIAGLDGYRLLDSMAVDSAGYICVGTLGQRPGLTVLSPDGSEQSYIPLPDPAPTNICFGGADLKTAFVTLSLRGSLISFPWPRAGQPLIF